MLTAALLVAALALAPIIGGGFGALASGMIQALVFAAVLILSWRGRMGAACRLPGMAALVALLAVVAVSTVFSEAIQPSLEQFLLLAACVGAYAVAGVVCRDRSAAAAAVWALVLSALGICLLGVRSYAISTGGGISFWRTITSEQEPMRLFGTFINPGFFAGFLVVSLPVTLGAYFVTRKSLTALLAGISLVLQTAALMLTGTKFGIISAVFALIVLFALAIFTGSLRRARFQRLIVIAIFLVPLLVVFSGPVKNRIAAAESGGAQVHSTQFRIYTWRATANMVLAQPWVGVGPGVFDIAYPRYALAGPTRYAHQSYLQLAAESGVFALLALLAALGTAAYCSLKGILRGPSDGTARISKDNQPAPGLSFGDLIPFSGWRMMNCAVFAALGGSVVRNLVDSDWYVVGIALPFWALAGLLVSQTTQAPDDPGEQRCRIGILLSIGAAAGLLLSGLFAAADYAAPDTMSADLEPSEALAGYRRAACLSPLDANYRRELGKHMAALASDEADRAAAFRQLDLAIRLAPTQASNYFARAAVAGQLGYPGRAAADLRRGLRFNPNSTTALYQLALVERELGSKAGFEATLRRLLAIEKTEHEQVKGIPELVDTTYAWAHFHFGEKYLAKRQWARAAKEFLDAGSRLEKWRSQERIRAAARIGGMLTEEDEAELTDLLYRSYLGLADAYAGMGNTDGAARARRKAIELE